MIGYNNRQETGACSTTPEWTTDQRSPADSASLVEISAFINVANLCSVNTANDTCPSWGDVGPTAAPTPGMG